MARRTKSKLDLDVHRIHQLVSANRADEAVVHYVAIQRGPRSFVMDAVGLPLCLRFERWGEARIAAERLIGEGRGDAGVHAAHARALLGLGEPDDALVALVRARDLDPADPSIYELEAIVQRARGDLAAALHAAEGAIALDPQRALAHGLSAELLELLGRGDEALERLRAAVRTLGGRPADHARLLGQLARLLEARGEHEEAATARALAARLGA